MLPRGCSRLNPCPSDPNQDWSEMVDTIDPWWLHNYWSFHKVCGKMISEGWGTRNAKAGSSDSSTDCELQLNSSLFTDTGGGGFRGSRDPREGSAGKQVLSHRSSVHTFRSLLTRSVRGKSIPHCPHTPSQTARHSCSEIQDTGVTGRVWGIYKRGKEKFTTRKPRRNSEDHRAGIYTFTQ